ncbi:cytoplasmic dynein 2 intermediate chain 1 isoform X1 [Brachyhypopomus gauderio]|uniref:cytoplasmic dynein 2 intermediate chain 1 isoform X1 n=1 Tax=Brachyhypopomus gauderio TaxID=698409 RepID=UPI00404374D3
MRHVQGQDQKSQRRTPSKREEQRTHRTGETTEHTQKDSERDVRRERERQREREGDREREHTRDRINLKDQEKYREEESRRKEKREKERRKEREREGFRDGEQLGWERRTNRDEKETQDQVDMHIQTYKDRKREENQVRYTDRERDRERERWKEKEREKRRKDKEKKEKDRGKDYDWERVRDWAEGRQREKESEREKRAERGKERKTEKERRKEKEGSRDVEDERREKKKEHDRDRRERHRERERPGEQDEWRERDRREKLGQLSGPVDRDERRERRRSEKEQQKAGGSVGDLCDDQETQRPYKHHHQHHHQHHGEGEAVTDRTNTREEKKKREEKRHEDSRSSDQRHQTSERIHSRRDQEVENETGEDDDVEGGMKNKDYEEDFEDYEEDFEDLDEDEGKDEEEDEKGEREGWRELSAQRRDEIRAIQRAMEEENELVSSAHSWPPTKEDAPAHKVSVQTESRPARVGTVIDFTAARQREISHTAHKQQKRCAELLRLIDLDFSVTESLLDLTPVSEYDLYIKRFGSSNTKQVYVQCNEDNTDRDTQTEEPDTHEQWTQHPAEPSAVCGGPGVSQSAPESVVWMNTDSKRLSTFLHSAAQVIAVLLEENRTQRDSVTTLQSHTHSLSCSDRSLQLNNNLPFLHGRQVVLLHCSPVQVHTLLSVHGGCSTPSDETLDTHSLLCVWNIWQPSAPQKILTCEAEVRSCCFSPGQLSLVFAGTAVGSVLLWDLREASCSHVCLRVDTAQWVLRYPTFSTDAVLSGAGHLSSVVSVEPVLATQETEPRAPLLEDLEEPLGRSFQLGSLDEHGLLILWVVVELPTADDSGSQTDLGLRPGGRVKLLHSSSLQRRDPSTSRGVGEVTGVVPHLSLLLKFLSSDSNHYFIGMSTGLVMRGTRHGLRAEPKVYTPSEGGMPAEVTTLNFCPNREPFFLVGCSDGTLRLHYLLRAEPVCEWRVGSGGVRSVCWCPTRPAVFCVLDAVSVLHVWDLAERQDGPISSEKLHPDRVTGMAVFGEASNRSSTSGVVLARQSSKLEIHFLKQSLVLYRPSDTETLHSLVLNTP